VIAERLEPLHDLVLVEKRDGASQTPAGVIIPDHSKKSRQDEGIVVAAGRGKLGPGGIFIETTLKPGDRVVFGQRAGNEVILNGKDLLLIPFDHIMAVLR
jgi:chaperonin GroES